MQVLVDCNIEGQANQLFAFWQKSGWAELLAIEFVYFSTIGLARDTDDTTIWRYAQANGMLILTNNRNYEDDTSLSAAIARENHERALPVVTIGNLERIDESKYREDAAMGLVEIITYLENNLGTGRLFIP